MRRDMNKNYAQIINLKALDRKSLNLVRFCLNYRGYTQEQRKKLTELLARDCRNESMSNNRSEVPVYARVHSPKKMIELLSMFSKSDNFKWYTHKWDQSKPFDLNSLIKSQRDNKSKLDEMVFTNGCAANQNTYNHVWNFINFANSQSGYTWRNNIGEKISIGWHSILELCRTNLCDPYVARLSDGHLFKDYVNMFKCSIEFRTDMGDMNRFSEFIINTIETQVNGALCVNIDSSVDDYGWDANFYCDVDALRRALVIVSDWMISHKVNGSDVYISIIDAADFYELKVLHNNSYFANIKKLENPSGDFAELRTLLFSVCDFEMQGRLKSDKGFNSVKVIALDSNVEEVNRSIITPCIVSKSDELVNGVQYIFRLYK